MDKVVAIIQARMGSTRLPKKMMLPLHGRPIIEWVLHRVKKSNKVNEVILAIPDSKENDPLETIGNKFFVNVVRGSEHDVLSRFKKAISSTQAKLVVRVCADNPLVDHMEINNLIDAYMNTNSDYVFNHIPLNNLYPDGLGAEIVSRELLVKIDKLATSDHNREHCLSYITEHPEIFKVSTFNPLHSALHRPDLKFDVDTLADLEKLRRLDIDIDSTAIDIVQLHPV